MSEWWWVIFTPIGIALFLFVVYKLLNSKFFGVWRPKKESESENGNKKS